MDMRSYIADFIYQKKMFANKNFICPLCNAQQQQKVAIASIQNFIYLDSNMLSYMFKDLFYTQGTKIFKYKDESYMRQKFMDRQKIRREDYIATQKDSQTEFTNLYCVVNQNLRIKEPLVLSNCPQKHIVDFKSFYEELKKIDFDIETKGLILCRCHTCNAKPIKTITSNIHFHEAFYEALNKFCKIENYTQMKSFTYQFQNKVEDGYIVRSVIFNHPKIKIVKQPKQGDIQNLRNAKTNEGFVDLMNDEEYQKFFGTTQIQGIQVYLKRYQFKH
ncbi:unnamed protein product [Paramecium sonneborni]|uniref:Uncharacterized protein n=1 Tax=Paramecium sonneborni TaxID=65129 RepID=A0A8S1RB11_9CILI|nr:unnamed protein product [Paramecium sonneborni]